MVSETTLRLLQDVGELKLYHVDEKDPASAQRKFSGVADQLANPTLNSLSRKSSLKEEIQETSARVEVHGYHSECSEENCDTPETEVAAPPEEKQTEVAESEGNTRPANGAEKEPRTPPPQHPQIIISIEKASLASNMASEEDKDCDDVDLIRRGCDSGSSEKPADRADASETQALEGGSNFNEMGPEVHKIDSDIDGGATEVPPREMKDEYTRRLIGFVSSESREMPENLPQKEAEMVTNIGDNQTQTGGNIEIIELEASAWRSQVAVGTAVDRKNGVGRWS